MGPIQGSMNQIANAVLNANLTAAIGKGVALSQKQYDEKMKEQINKATTSLKNETGVPTHEQIGEHIKAMDEILKDPIKTQESLERQPEEFEKLVSDEQNALINAYIDDSMNIINDFLSKAAGNQKMAETVNKKINQRTQFEINKKFLEGYIHDFDEFNHRPGNLEEGAIIKGYYGYPEGRIATKSSKDKTKSITKKMYPKSMRNGLSNEEYRDKKALEDLGLIDAIFKEDNNG